jgi:hypothetical protein
MAVDAPQVDCPAGAAARAEDIQPRRSSDQRSPNGGRPQHVAAGGEASIPAVDDELRLEARDLVRLQLGGTGLDVEPCPDAHRASIEAPVCEVDPAFTPSCGRAPTRAREPKSAGKNIFGRCRFGSTSAVI